MTKKPNILVYIGNEDPTRGDAHGWKGIGTELANILGGDLHYIERRLLDDFYPERINTPNKLRHYFQARGFPDIVMSAYSHGRDVKIAMGEKEPSLFFEQYNESIAHSYLGSGALVAHHLTPSLLKEEGSKFREAYPGLPSPLTAVIFDRYFEKQHLWKLVSACAMHPEGTIFLCGSRNTLTDVYNDVHDTIKKELLKNNLGGRLRLEGYNFDRWRDKRRVYNPYIGLLNEADHIVVASSSRSLLSEPLAAGKRIVCESPSSLAHEMQQRGLARHFNNCTHETLFENDRIAPIRTAREIALKIAAKYEAKTMGIS